MSRSSTCSRSNILRFDAFFDGLSLLVDNFLGKELTHLNVVFENYLSQEINVFEVKFQKHRLNRHFGVVETNLFCSILRNKDNADHGWVKNFRLFQQSLVIFILMVNLFLFNWKFAVI